MKYLFHKSIHHFSDWKLKLKNKHFVRTLDFWAKRLIYISNEINVLKPFLKD